MPAQIELHNIIKDYTQGDQRQQILRGVDVQINAGELVAIMGASGSGKTTLLNLIGLLDRPTGGQYLLKGQDVTNLSENARADMRNQAFGFVFQAFYLLPHLTILQNVGLPLFYRQMEESLINEYAIPLIEKVGLGQHIQRKPYQLSGGQQQRAAIARALVGKPDIILGDEPTGALDTETGQMIMNLLREFNQKEGITTVLVTHDPRIAAQCGRTIHIRDGRIVTAEEQKL